MGGWKRHYFSNKEIVFFTLQKMLNNDLNIIKQIFTYVFIGKKLIMKSYNEKI